MAKRIVPSVIAIYDSTTNQLYNVTVITKDAERVTLLQYFKGSGAQPYRHRTFQDVYSTVLSLLYQNGFKVKSWQDFGKDWYNIQWIDLYSPTTVGRFSY